MAVSADLLTSTLSACDAAGLACVAVSEEPVIGCACCRLWLLPTVESSLPFPPSLDRPLHSLLGWSVALLHRPRPSHSADTCLHLAVVLPLLCPFYSAATEIIRLSMSHHVNSFPRQQNGSSLNRRGQSSE